MSPSSAATAPEVIAGAGARILTITSGRQAAASFTFRKIVTAAASRGPGVLPALGSKVLPLPLAIIASADERKA